MMKLLLIREAIRHGVSSLNRPCIWKTPPFAQENKYMEITGLVLYASLEQQYNIWFSLFQSFSITAHLIPTRELDDVHEPYCLVFQVKC